MKLKNLLQNILALVILGLIISACVSDDQYETPVIGEIIDGNGPIVSDVIPFGDNFESNIDKWQMLSKKGTLKWTKKTYTNNSYIQMSSYSSGATQNVITYAISPLFDMDAQNYEYMTFGVNDGYSNGVPLKLMYSSDFDGTNFLKATWAEIAIPNIAQMFKTTSGYGSTFVNSGKIDLSNLTGKVCFAFVYDSQNATVSSTAQVDNLVIGTERPNEKPTVSTLTIAGNLRVNELLTASYTFDDAYGGSDMSTIKWYRADDATGTNKTEITGAITTTYTTTAADLNKYIAFEVTPNDGIDTNVAVLSTYVGPIDAAINLPPVASALMIVSDVANSYNTGNILTASYTYTDANGDVEGTSTYKWYYADDATGTNKIEITGATAKTYTLPTASVVPVGKYILFEVTPNDGVSNGTAVLSTGVGPTTTTVPSFGLTNGGFENGLTSWTSIGGNAPILETSIVHSGTQAVKHNAVTATSSWEQRIPVTAGDVITITLWYNVISGDGSDARIWSSFYNSAGTLITTLDTATKNAIQGPNNSYFSSTPNGTWQSYTTTVTVPADATTFAFQVRAYAGSTVVWDDFSVTK